MTRTANQVTTRTQGWTQSHIKEWAEAANPHCRKAITILANSKVPLTVNRLNQLAKADSKGPLIGGLQSWATRMGRTRPLVRVGQGFDFASKDLKNLFVTVLGRP